jgi:hypothetical protein
LAHDALFVREYTDGKPLFAVSAAVDTNAHSLVLVPPYCTEVTAVTAPLTPGRPTDVHDGPVAAYAADAPRPTPAAAVAVAAPIAIRLESLRFLETLCAMTIAPSAVPFVGMYVL